MGPEAKRQDTPPSMLAMFGCYTSYRYSVSSDSKPNFWILQLVGEYIVLGMVVKQECISEHTRLATKKSRSTSLTNSFAVFCVYIVTCVKSTLMFLAWAEQK